MVYSKSHIINTLFVLAFPFYGIGKYLAQVGNFSIGQSIAVLPLMIIIFFFLTDVVVNGELPNYLNKRYLVILFFSLLCVLGFIISFNTSLPGLNNINTITLCIFSIIVIHGPIVVQYYNRRDNTFSVEHLLYLGLSIDIGLNLLGFVMGLRNPVHSIVGRLNLPFGQGFYATANTVAILNLIILGKLLYGVEKKSFKRFLTIQLIINFFLMLQFNSRLSMLIFLLAAGLTILGAIYYNRLIFLASVFLIPFLLSSTELIYNALTLPVFSRILKRVSYNDITGFNGRRDLWENGIDWMSTAGQGFLWGNGYRGHYQIGLLDNLERFWNKTTVNMHMHSSMLEYSLSIGIIGLAFLLLLMAIGFGRIARLARENHRYKILIAPFIYLLFLFQIDNYVYILNYGALILFTLISTSLIKHNETA